MSCIWPFRGPKRCLGQPILETVMSGGEDHSKNAQKTARNGEMTEKNGKKPEKNGSPAPSMAKNGNKPLDPLGLDTVLTPKDLNRILKIVSPH